jgi:hypothetical protein
VADGIGADVFSAILALSSLLAAGWGVAALRPAWVVARPGRVLGCLGLLSALAVGALIETDPLRFGLSVDPSTEPLLPLGDPARDVYRDAVLDFGDDEVYVVALECEEVFSTDCLSAMQRVSDRLARLDGVRSVSSLVDVTSFRWVEEEQWVEIRPFIDDVPSDPAVLSELRERGLHDPVYRQILVAPSGRAAAINLSFRAMDDAAFIASDLDGQVLAILDDERAAGLRFHVAGRPHVKVHVYRGILRDLVTLIPLAVVGMAAVLCVFMGAGRGSLLPIGTALLACLWTFGAMAALDFSLTLLTGLLAPMLLAIGSVYGVHLLSRYEEEARGAPDAASAALRCLEHIRLPASIAGLTTIIGFGALLVSDVPAVVEFGLFSMFGIASATVLSLAGMPAALALLPLGTPAGTGSARHQRLAHVAARGLDAALVRLASWVSAHATVLISAWAGVALIAALLIPRIEIDTDYLSYFDRDDPVRVEFEAVNRLLAGAVPIYVVVDGAEPGALREPELLRGIETLQREIDAVPGVSRTLSFLETLRKLNRAFQRDEASEERIPDTRPAVTELLFMLPKSDMSRLITVDHRRANIIVRTGEVGSAAVLALSDALERVVAENPLPHGARAVVTANTILLSRSADGIARGQPWSIGLAAVAIFVLITVALRSARLGALAMLPNLMPVLLFFGLLGLGIANLSLPTSLIGCMALGIAIDDTVHFLVRYRVERSAGASPEQAALACSRFIGRPIAVTSMMLALGFGVVTASEFATLREFGMLSAGTMALCLCADLVLFPAVLLRTRS